MNADLVGFAQSRSPHREATLDRDACLVETHQQEALHSYNKYRAYQPLTTRTPLKAHETALNNVRWGIWELF